MARALKNQNAFHPDFPLFLIARNGRPLVSSEGNEKAAFAYSNRERAELAGVRFLAQDFQNIGVLSVSTKERFVEVISQLMRHKVTHLSWDYLGDPATRKLIPLASIPRR